MLPGLTPEKLDGLSQPQLDQKLLEACWSSDLDSVKYILTSPELKNHADIKGWSEEGIICACRTGNLELIDYMLRSPELKVHSDIHAWHDMIFSEACRRKDVELLNYLIFDYKIDKTKEISACLEKQELPQIAKVFELGDKAEKLTKKDFPKDEPIKAKKKRYK